MLRRVFIFNRTQTAAVYREALDLIWSRCDLQLSGCVARKASVSPPTPTPPPASCREVRGGRGGKVQRKCAVPEGRASFPLTHHPGSLPILRITILGIPVTMTLKCHPRGPCSEYGFPSLWHYFHNCATLRR